MIELGTEASRRPRRPRAWLYLTAIVLVAAVAGAAFLVHSSGRDQLRFEVETRSGTALRITWNVDVEKAEQVKPPASGKGIPTPWSTTVTVRRLAGTATLMAMSTDTDEVTCRITANGRTVAEGSRDRAMACVFNLADLATER